MLKKKEGAHLFNTGQNLTEMQSKKKKNAAEKTTRSGEHLRLDCSAYILHGHKNTVWFGRCGLGVQPKVGRWRVEEGLHAKYPENHARFREPRGSNKKKCAWNVVGL